tara:strand:+ start:1516 stop:2490 length:975 start_codon:yes stop_codon:yes gene_type:complete
MPFQILLSLFLTLILIILGSLNFISSSLGVYGNSRVDEKRVPLIGGLIILIFFNLGYLICYNIIDYDFTINIVIISFFLLGYIDDKLNLSPIIRIISQFSISVFFLSFNDFYLIKQINLFNYSHNLDVFTSYFFTSLCIVFLINCMNYFDGLNGLLIFFIFTVLILFFYLNKLYDPLILLTLVTPLIFVFYLNILDKIFLGDSGVYVLSFILTLVLIFLHNNIHSPVYEKSIMPILICFIPLLDFIRVSFTRFLKKKSLFFKDSNHLHDLFFNKYGNFYSLVLLSALQLAFTAIILIFYKHSIQLILIFLIIYLLIFFHLKENK